ncbi:MAG: indolepyruvate oxidoreductase subunit beta [Clostridia bacterium]|nr:indolepyruvate oxidoreductase subunit beta [Clostridia bacterium]MBR7141775.1 indolepyruvate oxidoreductase subunit beta [Clostridia bacterium]
MMDIMVVGVGGQGTLLTSRIIGKTALNAGYDVKLSEVHGMAQRGGSVVTYVRFGDKVYEPTVEEGKADVLIAFEKLEAKRYAHYLKKDGIIIVNESEIAPMSVVIGQAQYPENIVEELKKTHTVYSIYGDGIAKSLGNSKVINSVVLGLGAKHVGFSEQEWLEVLKQTVPPKTVEVNVLAFKNGYERG